MISRKQPSVKGLVGNTILPFHLLKIFAGKAWNLSVQGRLPGAPRGWGLFLFLNPSFGRSFDSRVGRNAVDARGLRFPGVPDAVRWYHGQNEQPGTRLAYVVLLGVGAKEGVDAHERLPGAPATVLGGAELGLSGLDSSCFSSVRS